MQPFGPVLQTALDAASANWPLDAGDQDLEALPGFCLDGRTIVIEHCMDCFPDGHLTGIGRKFQNQREAINKQSLRAAAAMTTKRACLSIR